MAGPGKQNLTLDLKAAQGICTAFAAATGVPCRLYDQAGALLIAGGDMPAGCTLCRSVQPAGEPPRCDQAHLYAARQAERFGGRYIYMCPSDLTFFASPVTLGGSTAGALVAGPVLIMDPEDFLAGGLHRDLGQALAGVPPEQLRSAISQVPRTDPGKLRHLSTLLFAVAVYVGENSLALTRSRRSMEQQQVIGSFIQGFKAVGKAAQAYPFEKERQLFQAVTDGDETAARAILNEILGQVLFASGGRFGPIRNRSLELLAIFSRAAVQGGADAQQILDLADLAYREIDRLRSPEDLMLWLADMIGRFTALVFDLVSTKHKKALYEAIAYMKRHYQRRLPLEEVSAQVGLTPTYFSKVFREEMGCTYSFYLGRLRVDEARYLLLTSNMPIVEICTLCGFEDQSYFTKVFKKYTGVTPSQCREGRSRLDPEKEREPLQ